MPINSPRPLLLASLLLSACVDSSDTAGVMIQASTRTSAMTSTDSTGAVFTVSAAMAHVRDVRFDLPSGVGCADIAGLTGARCEPSDRPADDSDEDTIIVDGPFVVDLITGAATPSLSAVRIPAGTYARVDVRLEGGRAGGGIAPGSALDGNAVAFTAAYDLEGQSTPVELRLDFSEDIRIDARQGVVVSADEDLIARFVVGDWLARVPLATCLAAQGVRPGQPMLVDDDVGGGACSDVENTLKDNFKRSGDLDRASR